LRQWAQHIVRDGFLRPTTPRKDPRGPNPDTSGPHQPNPLLQVASSSSEFTPQPFPWAAGIRVEQQAPAEMGQCMSKPAGEPDRTAVEQSKPVSAAVPAARQPASSPGETQSIDILPAPPSVAPSVAILPPWVSHNDTDMGRRASSSTAVSTSNASNPAANALRSNLSEVRAGLWLAPIMRCCHAATIWAPARGVPHAGARLAV
jgi:hypothetical protein